MACILWDRAWSLHTLRPHGQSMRLAGCKPCTPAIGRRTSRPSRTSRETLSLADADASKDEETDTCECRCRSSLLVKMLVSQQPFKAP